ncbi:helix-turn-helix transcriptional regulator [Yersinia enterocolitica]|uniref:helix-turn-helix transcriptional regulator n=1 Tax=Yersinia enterocolitica TaxID=630 RepID=UPI00398C9627
MFRIFIISKNNFFKNGVIKVLSSLFKNNKNIMLSDTDMESNKEDGKIDLLFIDKNYIGDVKLTNRIKSISDSINVFLLGNKTVTSYFLTKKTFEDGTVNLVDIDRNTLDLIGEINETLKAKSYNHNKIRGSVTSICHDNILDNKKLTSSERDVITKFIGGLSGKMIAKVLRKSEKTVSQQKRNAMGKLGAKTNYDLINFFSKINVIQ